MEDCGFGNELMRYDVVLKLSFELGNDAHVVVLACVFQHLLYRLQRLVKVLLNVRKLLLHILRS